MQARISRLAVMHVSWTTFLKISRTDHVRLQAHRRRIVGKTIWQIRLNEQTGVRDMAARLVENFS